VRLSIFFSSPEGDSIKYFYFIRSGECVGKYFSFVNETLHAIATRSLSVPNKPKPIQVKIGTFSKMEYFGEEGVLMDSHQSQGSAGVASSSIYASKKSSDVEVGVMSCYDAKNKINYIPKNPMHLRSNGEIKRMHEEAIARKKWEHQKKLIFDAMAREKMVDPNMTALKYKKLQTKKPKHVWMA
jgi:hypothetical protein